MHTTTTRRGDEQRLDLTGRLTADRHDEKLADLARRMLGQGTRRLVLDLGHISYMDSTCLGELIAAYDVARAHDAELRLVNVPPRVRRLLDISGLTDLFVEGGGRSAGRTRHSAA